MCRKTRKTAACVVVVVVVVVCLFFSYECETHNAWNHISLLLGDDMTITGISLPNLYQLVGKEHRENITENNVTIKSGEGDAPS